MALTQTCLCLLTRVSGDGEPQVLLGYKKTGLGTGKIVVALGGHVEERETAAQARGPRGQGGVRHRGGGRCFQRPRTSRSCSRPARPGT